MNVFASISLIMTTFFILKAAGYHTNRGENDKKLPVLSSNISEVCKAV